MRPSTELHLHRLLRRALKIYARRDQADGPEVSWVGPPTPNCLARDAPAEGGPLSNYHLTSSSFVPFSPLRGVIVSIHGMRANFSVDSRNAPTGVYFKRKGYDE